MKSGSRVRKMRQNGSRTNHKRGNPYRAERLLKRASHVAPLPSYKLAS